MKIEKMVVKDIYKDEIFAYDNNNDIHKLQKQDVIPRYLSKLKIGSTILVSYNKIHIKSLNIEEKYKTIKVVE